MRVTAETRAATRERILEAARHLFAQQGFDAATTREIAGAAQIAVGTLFNYFPTKEAIVLQLITEAQEKATETFQKDTATNDGGLSLEEELFGCVAVCLRKLRPYRRFIAAALETHLSPLLSQEGSDGSAFRTLHLETVSRIFSRHGGHESLSTMAFQLYWTLYTGVLSFWARDNSPRQEDTLALIDQSFAMFVGWLRSTGQVADTSGDPDHTL